jgi:hypothetical protein
MTNLTILSNKEIVFMFFSIENIIFEYEDIFEKHAKMETLEILPGNFITTTAVFSEEEIEEMKNTDHYIQSKAIYDKLKPIVDLIKDSFPQIYNEVEDMWDANK